MITEVSCWGLGLPSYPCSWPDSVVTTPPSSHCPFPLDLGKYSQIRTGNMVDTQPTATLISGL